jgi:hypothetical protein
MQSPIPKTALIMATVMTVLVIFFVALGLYAALARGST